MKDRLKQLKKDTKKIIDLLEDAQIYGAQEFMECSLDNIESALEEYEEYEGEQE